MARDRQRAKQRKARRAAQNPGPAPSEPHRSNVPGELEHSSGEVDEFEAAIVAGADGEPVEAGDRDDDAYVADGAYDDEDADDADAFADEDEDDDVADDRAAVATRGAD